MSAALAIGLPYLADVSCAEARHAESKRKGAAAERRQHVAAFDALCCVRPVKPPRSTERPEPSQAGARALQRDLRLGIVPIRGRV